MNTCGPSLLVHLCLSAPARIANQMPTQNQCKDAGAQTVAPDSEVRLPGSGVRWWQEWRLELRGPGGGAVGTWGATQRGNDGARAELLGKLQAWPASSPSHGLARDPG